MVFLLDQENCRKVEYPAKITIIFQVINQKREVVFHPISKQRELESGKYDNKWSIFEIRSVWKSDETLSRVFGISSQSN